MITHYEVDDQRFSFRDMMIHLQDQLLAQFSTVVGEWQSQKIETPMRELLHVAFAWQMPEDPQNLAIQTGARLPWAEDHFLERVGGEPLNPSPSEAWWPFAKKQDGTNVEHKSEGEAFSHTYPERMWPKLANVPWSSETADNYRSWVFPEYQNRGIRFDYGDLNDVVNQLSKSPNTRQAYLPIWFPEDTGAVHGKRVPCTLGYHFIIRDGILDISYFMRSTDLLRHFQDDIYLAVRLAQWVVKELKEEKPHRPLRVGQIVFHTANMHIFEPDVEMILHWRTQGKVWF